MNIEDKEKLKCYLVNQGLRVDQDLQDARLTFQQEENAWTAFRLALAAERKNCFDMFACHLCALLHI